MAVSPISVNIILHTLTSAHAIFLQRYLPTCLSSAAQICDNQKSFFDATFEAAECKLPLARAGVLLCANAKSLHALWPIRTPMSRLHQSERHVPAAPIRTHELSSRQRRILTQSGASRLHTHAQYKFSSPLYVFGQRAFLSLGSTTSHFTFIG